MPNNNDNECIPGGRENPLYGFRFEIINHDAETILEVARDLIVRGNVITAIELFGEHGTDRKLWNTIRIWFRPRDDLKEVDRYTKYAQQ